MTNQEWLLTLKSSECALFCLEYLPRISRNWSSSRHGIDLWLQSEHMGCRDVFVNEFNQIIELEQLLTHQHKAEGE